jgi:hypothetical protein
LLPFFIHNGGRVACFSLRYSSSQSRVQLDAHAPNLNVRVITVLIYFVLILLGLCIFLNILHILYIRPLCLWCRWDA